MGGRYGLILETHEQLAGRLSALIELMNRLSLPVERIRTLGGEDAVVLGHALARRWNVESVPCGDDEVPDAGTLIVAAAASDLARVPLLARRRPGVVVYSHKLDWTRSTSLSPDIIGLVVQAHFFPWNRAYRLEPSRNRVVDRPPDRRPPVEIADHLEGQLPAGPPESLAGRLDFYVRHRDLSLFAGDSRVQRRPPFRQESPVAGNRFQ
jgi:hypothetical protein